jgi:hypothetical protein
VQRASVVLPDDKSRRRGAYTRRSDSWAWKRNQSKNMYMSRVGQNCVYTPYI